jgi:serine/threonine protein kinase
MEAEVLGTVASTEAASTAEGFRVGPFDDPDRYEIGEPVEAGAEGILYRGRLITPTSRLTLSVAVKALQPAYAARIDQWAARWRDQVELLRSLQIPGLVGVREGFVGPLPHRQGSDTAGRNLYLVMNWVEGEALDHWVLRHRGVDVSNALKLLLPVAVAVDTMHAGQLTGSVPVVHRDIKPANILIGKGGSVLVDFGLTKGLSIGHPVGRAGTPGYIAPEVVAGGGYTPAADRYAFGATVFFLLTGRHPSTANNLPELRRYLESAPVGGGISPELVDRVVAMLDPDPDRRPAALANWIAQLRQSSLDDETLTSRLPPPAPARAPQARLGSGSEPTPSVPGATYPGLTTAGFGGPGTAGPRRRQGAHRAHKPPMHARPRVRVTQHYALALVLAVALIGVASDAVNHHPDRGSSVTVTGGAPSEAAGVAGLTRRSGGSSAVVGPGIDFRSTNTEPEAGSAGATSGIGAPGGLITSTTTGTTPPTCVKSYLPACGPLRYVPAVVNPALTVSFTYSPAHPQPGDQVTFTVVLDDPDDGNLQIQQQYYGIEVGGATSQLGAVGAGPLGRGCQQPYGTWPPPPPGPHGHISKQTTYTYSAPGTYAVHFFATSGQAPASCATPDPYASSASSAVQNVTVDPPPPPPTTTTTSTTEPPPPPTTTTVATIPSS